MVQRDPKTGKVTILESTIRDAMSRTPGNRAAARLLKVSYPIYKKWASSYVDSDSGKTLFELHLGSPAGVPRHLRRGRVNKNNVVIHSLQDIVDNKVPDYPMEKLKHRLWRAGWKEKKCNCCGFEEVRISDQEAPLLLSHVNGDKSDYSLDNLEVLCFNCFFLTVGNLWGVRKWRSKKGRNSEHVGMAKKDMIEGVEVDDDGIPTNVDKLATFESSGVTPEEVQADDLLNADISKEDIEDLLRGL